MTKAATLRPEQIRQARKLLNELPVRDNKKTREEAAGLLEKDFRKAFKKGYSPKELSLILKNAGIIIPAYLMEKFLKEKKATETQKKENGPNDMLTAFPTEKNCFD